MDACCRSDINNVIRCAHRILVMLYNDQGIAQILQVHQGVQQLVVIALMQSDTRLVQNIRHSDKSRTDLCCKADSLCLPAGQARSTSRKCEVFQTYFL